METGRARRSSEAVDAAENLTPLFEMPSKAGGPADCGSGCNFDLERTIERHMSECITQLYLAHCQHLRAQAKKHLAQANRHIAELMVQIVRQRVIVKYALDAGQRSETAESLLHAIAKEPRPIREASRTGSRSVEAPTVQVMGSSKRPDPPGDARRTRTCQRLWNRVD